MDSGHWLGGEWAGVLLGEAEDLTVVWLSGEDLETVLGCAAFGKTGTKYYCSLLHLSSLCVINMLPGAAG